MSFRLHDYYVIQPEDPEPCAFCGAVKECRPLGPDDERISGRCADRDAETAKAKMGALMRGVKAALNDPYKLIHPDMTEREVERMVKRLGARPN